LLSAAFHFRDNFLPATLRASLDTQAIVKGWDWHVWMIGTLVIVVAAALEGSYGRHRAVLEDLQTQCEQALSQSASTVASQESEIETLRNQLEVPRLSAEVVEYRAKEVDHGGLEGTGILAYTRNEVEISVSLKISNLHRIETQINARTLRLVIHDGLPEHGTKYEPARIDSRILNDTVKFAAPMTASLAFSVQNSDALALQRRQFQILLQDGCGVDYSTASRVLYVSPPA